MPILLWLLRLVGVRRLTDLGLRIVRWLSRLFIAVVIVVIIALCWTYAREKTIYVALAIVALVVGRIVFRVWANRRRVEVFEDDLTINGKEVPEKLAVSALSTPRQSPDVEYVLRGLPDYGKVLLKLNTADFEYVPEPPEKLPEMPSEDPAANHSWPTIPRRAIAAACTAVLLVVAVMGGLLFYRARQQEADRQRQVEQQAEADRQRQAAQQTEADRRMQAQQAEADRQRQTEQLERAAAELRRERMYREHQNDNPPITPKIDPDVPRRPVLTPEQLAKLAQAKNQIAIIEDGANRVNPVIENTKRILTQQGSVLRPDITSHQSGMTYHLRQAVQAIDAQDPEDAVTYANQAQADLNYLMHWAGLQ